MKGFITPAYTFDASAQTVDLSGISGFNVKRLVAIINQTDGVLIYSTANPSLRFTNVAGTVVTLNYDTTAMADADVLQVIYETADDFATETTLVDVEADLIALQAQIDALLDLFPTSIGQKVSANSLSVVLSSNSTVPLTPQTPSYQEIVDLTTVAQTFTAPANAKTMVIQADDQNAVTLRYKIGGAAATTTSGFQLQEGRSEPFPFAGDVSVIAESGTNKKVYIQYGV